MKKSFLLARRSESAFVCRRWTNRGRKCITCLGNEDCGVSNVAAKAQNGWPFGHVAQAVRFVVEWMWFLIFKLNTKRKSKSWLVLSPLIVFESILSGPGLLYHGEPAAQGTQAAASSVRARIPDAAATSERVLKWKGIC